ncbi:MAG: sodium:calcium antiporter, partial [Clostridia bacterium]|nr:sodium:calcium antiporter [Clostridia bacterium]
TWKEKKNIILFFIAGIISILIGSNLLIDNGIIIAEYLGVPEAVISLTFIAFGTSLPEFTTAITSLVKKKPAIGLGNIIGANILNICLVIGLSALFSPLEVIPQNLSFDLPIVMLLTLILTLPVLVKKKTYSVQGLLFIIIYIFFISMTFKNT